MPTADGRFEAHCLADVAIFDLEIRGRVYVQDVSLRSLERRGPAPLAVGQPLGQWTAALEVSVIIIFIMFRTFHHFLLIQLNSLIKQVACILPLNITVQKQKILNCFILTKIALNGLTSSEDHTVNTRRIV
jgi:hypothetical protein